MESSEPPRVRVVEVELHGIFCRRKRAEFHWQPTDREECGLKIEAARFPISRGPSNLSASRIHCRPLTSHLSRSGKALQFDAMHLFGFCMQACKPLPIANCYGHVCTWDPGRSRQYPPPCPVSSMLSAKVCQTVNHPPSCDELSVIGGVMTSKCT